MWVKVSTKEQAREIESVSDLARHGRAIKLRSVPKKSSRQGAQGAVVAADM